ncbi:MAG: protein-L-isoaspartate(D-aspartate) O-methyltransferase [Chlorobi bacterium]|nr:protein-L-isoaspartate(D-aspartate) O-methyltransferase [Chlorobiota bacterium]
MVRNDIHNSFYKPVKDRKVLEAMENVPRHLFVPKVFRDQAYENKPLPIGYGQTISQPIIVAQMTELLDIKPGDKILEIGTGSGYQAAVLSELTPYVYTVEIVRELGEQAKARFSTLGYNTIKVKIGDGYKGWPEYAPYDGIIVTCAPEEIPEPLIEQLKPGGRIVIPVGKAGKTQWLVLVEKTPEGKIREQVQFPVVFVPMTGKAGEK